ncbi:MAG TPA: hypothetical protein VG269_17315 [Tepidisphaeraceae bacterium]|jgi:hypothetical protein|nr:hypothetical protein [Tepidisphaeraceae bacterium]
MKIRAWSNAVQQGAIGAAVGLLLTLPITLCLGMMGAAWAFALLVMLPSIGAGFLTGFGAFRREIERERRVKGLCIRCGYDLRATADRCPECGRKLRIRQPVPATSGEAIRDGRQVLPEGEKN